MTDEQRANTLADPSFNARENLDREISHQNDMRWALDRHFTAELRRIDHATDVETERANDKFKDEDIKYQIQFNAAKEALGIALIAQEKAVAAALDSTKEAIGKAEIATDKRFDLLSEKIDGVNETLNKNAGAQGIYVTHSDLTFELDKLRTSFETMLTPVVTFMNSTQGSTKGMNALWGYFAAAVGVIVGVVGIVLAIVK